MHNIVPPRINTKYQTYQKRTLEIAEARNENGYEKEFLFREKTGKKLPKLLIPEEIKKKKKKKKKKN